MKSTGKERDAETGLDFFFARCYSGAQGRFTSPDPKMFPGHVDDPQSWNKYGYTQNNPLKYVDPNGEDWTLVKLWEGFKQYGRELVRPLTNAIANHYQQDGSADARDVPIAPGLPSRHELVKAHAETMAKGTGLVADAVTMIDPTGIGSATRSALAGDAKGTVLAMAPLAMPQIRVIGHYPAYVNLGEQMGAKYFQVPMKIWEAMSTEAQWAANQTFLDRAIKQGAAFTLATGRDQVRKGSALRREIEYLLKNGYEWGKDGSQLVRGAR